MPQASDELRNKMITYFGSLDDVPPAHYLRNKGWTENKYRWSIPYADADLVSPKEWDCISFLVHEWDHGYAPKNKSS